MVQHLEVIPIPNRGPKIIRVLTYAEMMSRIFAPPRRAVELDIPPGPFVDRTHWNVEPNVWS